MRSLGTLAVPFDWRTIGLARRIPHRKEGTNLSFLKFLRRRRAQRIGVRRGLSGSAELGDSKTRKADALREKSLHHNAARLWPDRRVMRGAFKRNSSKMARK